MAWLEYGGRLRKLPDGLSVVGSGADATFRVDDADLLPRHFILHPRDAGVEVAAFSPDAVVRLAQEQIGTEARTARYGDPIHAGSAEFHVWAQQPGHHVPADMAPSRAYLVDEREEHAVPLDRTITTIGRSSANLVRLTDPTASRFHAQIRREAGGFALHVVGSAGGSINGRRVAAPRLLDDGDVIELAHATFRFVTGPLPPKVRIVPVPPDTSPAQTERPTVARERISLSQPVPAAPPTLLRTAMVLGVLTAIAAAAAALVLLL